MKPSAFEYYRPTSVDEAVAMLVEHGDDARLLAGGQSLVPLMNLRMATPPVLVDLNRVRDLAYIREDAGALAIGAMTRYADVEASPLVRERLPILVEATAEVGYVGIRNRGTVGGAIAHADPVAEWPCLALALDAQVVLAGPQARRTLTVDDFFLGMFETAIAPGEMLVEVRFPARAARSGWGFREFSRKTGDYAVVAVAVDIGATGGTIDHVRVAISNLADRPVRSARVEQLLTGRDAGAGADDAVLAAVPGAVAAEHPAGPEPALRHEIAGTLVARAITDALARLQGGADE